MTVHKLYQICAIGAHISTPINVSSKKFQNKSKFFLEWEKEDRVGESREAR